jgi:hypothetical protein
MYRVHQLWVRNWYQLGQLPKVLGGCCEEGLVMGYLILLIAVGPV